MCSSYLEPEASADVNHHYDASFSSCLNCGVLAYTMAVSQCYARFTSTSCVECGVSIRIAYYSGTDLDRRRRSYSSRADGEYLSYVVVTTVRTHNRIGVRRGNIKYSFCTCSHLVIAENIHHVTGSDFL